MRPLPLRTQALRYAVVGIASNLFLYLLYLFLTSLGIGHKSAMTGLYVLGVLQTFVFNRAWSFAHDGQIPAALLRYGLAYAGGYLLNLAVLILLVDQWGFPHEVVQGVMIVSLAGLLFLLQRYWVFRSAPVIPLRSAEAGPGTDVMDPNRLSSQPAVAPSGKASPAVSPRAASVLTPRSS